MINKFSGEYRFLSNFYPVSVVYDSTPYPSVEHAYQAAKTIDSTQRSKIRHASSPALAKKLGAQATLRDGWDKLRLPVMRYLLDQKFLQPVLRKKLLATGDEELIEGNDWGDTFWGKCNGKGENHLGQILMEIRANITR